MSQPHWTQMQEAGAYNGLRIMFWIYRTFGRIPFQIALYPVVLYFFLFNKSARAASLEYIEQLKQNDIINKNQSNFWLSYQHFLNFSSGLLDKLAVWLDDITLDDIHFHNRELLEGMCEKKQGGLIIASHLGNMEICRALSMQRQDVKINVLMNTEVGVKFTELLKKSGANSQVNVISVNTISPATAMILQNKLDAGEFIVLTGDRTSTDTSSNNSIVNFLGRPAEFPQGPLILASLLKCPVLAMFCLRSPAKAQTKYDIHLDLFADIITLPRKSRPEALLEYNQEYANTLAHYCAKAPLQWYNFFPFWLNQSNPND